MTTQFRVVYRQSLLSSVKQELRYYYDKELEYENTHCGFLQAVQQVVMLAL